MIMFAANTACASHHRPHRINGWYVYFERKTKLKCEMRYDKVCKVTVHLLRSHRNLRYDSELCWPHVSRTHYTTPECRMEKRNKTFRWTWKSRMQSTQRVTIVRKFFVIFARRKWSQLFGTGRRYRRLALFRALVLTLIWTLQNNWENHFR